MFYNNMIKSKATADHIGVTAKCAFFQTCSSRCQRSQIQT